MQAFGNLESRTGVPTCLIEDQENLLVWPSSLVLGESGQRQRKGRGIDGRHEQPTGLSALGLHKPIEIHPLIARSDHGPYSGPLARPDAAQNWFEADAVLILAPQFKAGFWIGLMQPCDLLWEFF